MKRASLWLSLALAGCQDVRPIAIGELPITDAGTLPDATEPWAPAFDPRVDEALSADAAIAGSLADASARAAAVKPDGGVRAQRDDDDDDEDDDDDDDDDDEGDARDAGAFGG